jgi:prepilin-type N-terminal cleavage/methylation domain-containing protein
VNPKSSRKLVVFGQSQNGFTIVELMVASVVFSTVLVVVTVGVIRFTNGYYRGINSSTTQATAQNAMDTVSQSVQFSSGGTLAGGISGNDGYFCAGSKVFTFSNGQQFGGAPTSGDRGLYVMENPAPGSCADPASISGGDELLGKGMRVIGGNVSTPTALTKYLSTVKLKVAYGDPDLLCSPSIAGLAKGSCKPGAINYTSSDDITNADTICKPQTASHFCSVVNLSTTVQQRLVVN